MALRPHRYRNAIVPHIYVDGASDAIAFYRRAFGAVELFRIARSDGKILHAEISICESVLMIGDPDNELYGEPRALGRCTASLHIFADDNEELLRRAVERERRKSNRLPTCFTARTPPAFAILLAMSGFFCRGSRISNRPKWNAAETRCCGSSNGLRIICAGDTKSAAESD